MGRKSLKEPRQKEIIIAFYELCKTDGLENASIGKLADRLQINPSLVMHYFKTKEALIYGLIDYILDRYLLIFSVPKSYEKEPKKKLTAVVKNIFSKKWHILFDDSVYYSCYALIFRNEMVRKKYEVLHTTLRKKLESIIIDCRNAGVINVADTAYIADLIFVLLDGAYYNLNLTTNKKEFNVRQDTYLKRALHLLDLSSLPDYPINSKQRKNAPK